MTNDIAEAREDLAAAYRLADRYGLSEGICNHLTLAVPGRDDRFLLIPYGMHWSEVTASSLLVVDRDGDKVEGEGFIEPTAFYIHGAIHKARSEARCVMHTHMPHALALCMIEDGRLEFADQNACRFYGRVAYDDDFNGVVLDWDEANRIAAALGGKDVLFMAHHGVTVVGETVARAWERLLLPGPRLPGAGDRHVHGPPTQAHPRRHGRGRVGLDQQPDLGRLGQHRTPLRRPETPPRSRRRRLPGVARFPMLRLPFGGCPGRGTVLASPRIEGADTKGEERVPGRRSGTARRKREARNIRGHGRLDGTGDGEC